MVLGRTKVPWLYSMAEVIILSYTAVFLPAFSHFSDSVYSLTKVFLKTKAGRGHMLGSFLARPHRVLLGYSGLTAILRV